MGTNRRHKIKSRKVKALCHFMSPKPFYSQTASCNVCSSVSESEFVSECLSDLFRVIGWTGVSVCRPDIFVLLPGLISMLVS